MLARSTRNLQRNNFAFLAKYFPNAQRLACSDPEAQYTYLYSRLTPAKTIVTCVHKKTSLEFMELLVSADATTISKRKCFFFNFLQGVEKSSKGIIKADKERKAAKTFQIMTFFLIYALFLILRKSDA